MLVAGGFTEHGARVLRSVMLGMGESHADWLELGRDLIARGLCAPLLVVGDGAPGLDLGSHSIGLTLASMKAISSESSPYLA